MSGAEVTATELPLARAAELVLSSMQTVLEKTVREGMGNVGGEGGGGDEEGKKRRRHLAETKMAEVRVVRNVRDLWWPGERYRAVEFEG